MAFWADIIKAMKSQLFANTLKNGNYEVDRARKDGIGNVINHTYATKAYIDEFEHDLVDGVFVVGVADYARKATKDGNGNNIADTYATKFALGTLLQDLDTGRFVVENARRADDAEQARQAERAIDDGNGNNIANTYATKGAISTLEQMIDEQGRAIHDGTLVAGKATLASRIQFNLEIEVTNGMLDALTMKTLYVSNGKKKIQTNTVAKQDSWEAGKGTTITISGIDAGSMIVFGNNENGFVEPNDRGADLPAIDRDSVIVEKFIKNTDLESMTYTRGFTIVGGGFGKLSITGKG